MIFGPVWLRILDWKDSVHNFFCRIAVWIMGCEYFRQRKEKTLLDTPNPRRKERIKNQIFICFTALYVIGILVESMFKGSSWMIIIGILMTLPYLIYMIITICRDCPGHSWKYYETDHRRWRECPICGESEELSIPT